MLIPGPVILATFSTLSVREGSPFYNATPNNWDNYSKFAQTFLRLRNLSDMLLWQCGAS